MNDAVERRPVERLAEPRAHRHASASVSVGSVFRRLRSRTSLPPLMRALRPVQWTKNAVLFAALVFDRKLFEPGAIARSVLAVVVFCALSSGVYLINDLRDVASDRLHPVKRYRPIAAGELRASRALTIAVALLAASTLGAWLVRPAFVAVAGGYLALMVLYSYRLKQLVILDVFAIAAGFVLRAAGGAVALDVAISPWLLVCTMLLALFVGFGKRRHEFVSVENASQHRANLSAYTLPLLDQLIGIVASATVIAYSIYTFDASNVPRNHAMMLTIPVVSYAIFRYLYLIHRSDLGGAPETLLFADRPLLASITVWGIGSLVILQLWG